MRAPAPNHILFTTDDNLHVPASRNNNMCNPCKSGTGYPMAHKGCPKDGFLHREQRWDLDAGGQTSYYITRCDKCNAIGIE